MFHRGKNWTENVIFAFHRRTSIGGNFLIWCNCLGPKMQPLLFPFKSQSQKYLTLSMPASFLCCFLVPVKIWSPAVFKLEFLNFGLLPWYFWVKWILFFPTPFLVILHLLLLMDACFRGPACRCLHTYSTSLFLLNYPFLFSCVISYCSTGLGEQQVCCWLAFWGFSYAQYCICLLVLWFVMFCLWLLRKV